MISQLLVIHGMSYFPPLTPRFIVTPEGHAERHHRSCSVRADIGRYRAAMSDLCILTVHAHPDDEASKGAGTISKYHDEGIRTVLVCCTGGEAGSILNEAMDRPEVRENLKQVRREELQKAADIIGYDRVHMLGYLDSGMPDTPENEAPGQLRERTLG